MAFLPEPIKLSIQAQLELVYGSRSGCFTRSTGIFEVSGNSHTGHHHPQHLVGDQDQVRQRGVVFIKETWWRPTKFWFSSLRNLEYKIEILRKVKVNNRNRANIEYNIFQDWSDVCRGVELEMVAELTAELQRRTSVWCRVGHRSDLPGLPRSTAALAEK